MKKILILILSLFLITSCSNKMNDDGNNVNHDIPLDNVNNTFREISYDEAQKYNFVGYKINYDNLLYKDINKDGIREAILILEDTEADEWVSDKYTSGKWSLLNGVKVLLLGYDGKSDSWSLLSNINLPGTVYKGIEFYDLDNITCIFVSYNGYGESDGHKSLSILFFKNGDLEIKNSFSTSITNGGDIIIKEDGKLIYEIDKIHGEGECRECCHKFTINEYKYDNGEYDLSKSKTTNLKYVISYKEKNSYELEDFYEDGCHNIGGRTYSTHSNKIKAILEDVGL